MTDYRRMEWQFWANKIAWWVKIVCIILLADEVAMAFRYHFPWWDDIAMPITTALGIVVHFVDRHTRMWRYDL